MPDIKVQEKSNVYAVLLTLINHDSTKCVEKIQNSVLTSV